MQRCFIQVTVPAPDDTDTLVGDLADTGILGASEADGVLRLYWNKEDWNAGILKFVANLLSGQGIECSEDSVTVIPVPDRDWNALWARSVRPIRITERLVIRQTWNEVDLPPGTIEIVIDPRRAFGTGFHPTTQLLLEWLEQAVSRGQRVLDVGTGSGILAMAALRFGAATALGIDNDPEAIACALENAQLNGFGDELQFRTVAVGSADAGRFDVVLANLDRKTFLRFAAPIAAAIKPEGKLLISGIQDGDVADITRAFEAAACQVLARREKAEWIALEFRPVPIQSDGASRSAHRGKSLSDLQAEG